MAECGDVCQQLRDNLKFERESKEKLSRENERLIKEIVEMNMRQERERLEEEISHTRMWIVEFSKWCQFVTLLELFKSVVLS